MAQGIVNLNDIVKALEKDAQTLSTVVEVCKAIGDIPVVGADIEKTQNSAQLLKDLSTQGLKPILKTIDKIEAMEIDPAKIDNINTVIQNFNASSDRITNTIQESTVVIGKIGKVVEEMNTSLEQSSQPIITSIDKIKNISTLLKSVTDTMSSVGDIIDPKNDLLSVGPIKILFVESRIRGMFRSINKLLFIILERMVELNNRVANIDTKQLDDLLGNISQIIKKITDIIDGINFCLDPKKNKLAVNPVKLFFAKLKIKRIFKAITEVLKLMMDKIQSLKNTVDNFDPNILDVVEKVAQLTKALKDIMKDICKMALLIIPFTIASLVVIIGLPILCGVILAIVGILQMIANIDVTSLSENVNSIKTLINDVKEIIVSIIYLSLFLLLAVPVILMGIIAGMFVMIELLIFVAELNVLIMTLSLINKKDLTEAKNTIRTIINIFLLLAGLMLMIVVMAIFMVDVLKASVIFILGVAVILIITAAILYAFKLISKLASQLKVKDLLMIIGVFGVILIIMVLILMTAALMLVIQEIAQKLEVGTIVLFILGLLGFAVVMGLLGLGCAAISTYLIPAAAAIVLVFVVIMVLIGVILITAVMLLLLQKIDLDFDKIQENILLIMATVKTIVASLFGPEDDTETEQSDKSFIKVIFESLGGGIAMILQALLAVAYLALMMVAILLILFIAVMLRLLQELDLNPSKIMQNVDIVMGTAQSVIDAIFDPQDDKKDDASQKGFFASLLEYLGTGILKILQAVMAVAYLALILVAILLIDFIATELLLLQTIKLNAEKIKTNVGIVMETAQLVVNYVFDPEDDKADKPSSKGFFMSILEFFCPALAKIFGAIMAIAYLALIIVAVALIVGIAKQLEYLQEIVLDEELIRTNVQTVIDTANMVTSSIFDSDDDKEDKPSSKGLFLTILDFFCPSLAAIFEAIMSIAYLALVIVAINLICEIAKQLEYIAKLDINAEAIKKNVTTIINLAKLCIDTIFAKDNTQTHSKGGAIERLLRWILGDSLVDLVKALMAVGYLAIVETAVGMLGKMARDLTAIAKLPSMKGIEGKVKEVTSAARRVINGVFSGGVGAREMVRLMEQAEDAERYLRKLMKIPGTLDALIKEFEKLKEFSKETEAKAVGVITSLINIVGKFDGMSSTALGKANQSNGILKSITKTVNDIDKIKINKERIQNIQDLMNNIISFANQIKDIMIPPMVILGLRQSLKIVAGFTGEVARNSNKVRKALPLIKQMTLLYGRFFRTLGGISVDMNTVNGIRQTFNDIFGFTLALQSLKMSKSFLNSTRVLMKIYGVFFRRLNNVTLGTDAVDSIKQTFDNLLDFTNKLQESQISMKFITQTDELLYTYYKFFRAMKDVNLTEAINKESLQALTDGTKVMVKFSRYATNNFGPLHESLDTLDQVFIRYCKLFRTIDSIGINRAKAVTVKSILESLTRFSNMNNGESVANSEKLLQNYDKFLTKVNDVKLSNLKTTTKMFEQMARFSESINGNFDGLADTLNDRIAPLMEELKQLLNDVQEKVAQRAEQPVSEMDAEKANIKSNMSTQGLTKEEVDKRVDYKYKQGVQQRYGTDEIASKLNQLINLFKNGDAVVRMS